MPLSDITIQIPDDLWIAQTSQSHPDATFTVLSTQAFDNTGVGLIELQAKNPVPIITEMDSEPDITRIELLWKQSDEALLQIETTNPIMLEAPRQAGVPLKTPFHVSNGTLTWEIITTQSDLSDLGDQLDAMGISYNLELVQPANRVEQEQHLTDRQREVLAHAFEAGYYDSPRDTTLTKVAESLEISPATCSDILHRAEGKIISSYLMKHLGP
jgi:predicted DNA binding protein